MVPLSHSHIKTLKHLFTEKIEIAKNGRLFQTVSLNQGVPRLRFYHQIKRFQESSMLSTIVAYLSHMIQVIHGANLALNGQKNIFYKLLGLLQLVNKTLR